MTGCVYMETIDCIKTRRSRRLFTDRPVEEGMIKAILEAAVQAPSSRNCQPWRFVIVKSEDKKKALAAFKTEENQRHILTAPVTIVVAVDIAKSPQLWTEDGVCAAMNILLAAHDLGLGAVYVSGTSKTEPEKTRAIQMLLELPETVKPVVIIPVGHPSEEEDVENRELPDIEGVVKIL
jgi:nitroreductase